MKPTIEDLIALRKQGWNSTKIARLYNLPYVMVEHMLNRTTRLVDAEKPEALSSNEEIFKLKRAGKNQKQIAKELGISTSLVCLILAGKVG